MLSYSTPLMEKPSTAMRLGPCKNSTLTTGSSAYPSGNNDTSLWREALFFSHQYSSQALHMNFDVMEHSYRYSDGSSRHVA
jgi:hypothetical protein